MKINLVLLILILAPGSLYGQMFSVDGESQRSSQNSSSLLRIGYAPVEFDYNGNSQSILPQDRLDFESGAFHIGLESPGLSASLSFINKLTGADDERYLNLSLEYINKFAFIRSQSFQMGVPLGLISSLVSVRNEQFSNDFSQTTFGVGAGMFASFRVPDKISVSLEGVPSYGFSNSSGGIFGGTNQALSASGRLNFLSLLPGRTLSIGYDYKYSSYDLDDDNFDYDLKLHLITIGVSL
jgi:hypothetical protein